jgi:hypothetical protein
MSPCGSGTSAATGVTSGDLHNIAKLIVDGSRASPFSTTTCSSAPRLPPTAYLLVTGTQRGEMVVIERTATRSAIRGPIDGRVVVTNDYRALDAVGRSIDGNRLQETACSRFDRITSLLPAERPSDARGCLLLTDPGVRMSITVQQMVMQPATGELAVHLPERSTSR